MPMSMTGMNSDRDEQQRAEDAQQRQLAAGPGLGVALLAQAGDGGLLHAQGGGGHRALLVDLAQPGAQVDGPGGDVVVVAEDHLPQEARLAHLDLGQPGLVQHEARALQAGHVGGDAPLVGLAVAEPHANFQHQANDRHDDDQHAHDDVGDGQSPGRPAQLLGYRINNIIHGSTSFSGRP